MRVTLTLLLLAIFASVGVSACSKSSSSSGNATDQTATSTAAATGGTSDNVASSPPGNTGGASGSPPIYPGAVPGVRPQGVALKAPPAKVKAYSTSDDFVTVKAWYKAQLKGAPEMAQPGMEKTEDAFLVGQGASGAVVMIQSFQGKTWILIGPPM